MPESWVALLHTDDINTGQHKAGSLRSDRVGSVPEACLLRTEWFTTDAPACTYAWLYEVNVILNGCGGRGDSLLYSWSAAAGGGAVGGTNAWSPSHAIGQSLHPAPPTGLRFYAAGWAIGVNCSSESTHSIQCPNSYSAGHCTEAMPRCSELIHPHVPFRGDCVHTCRLASLMSIQSFLSCLEYIHKSTLSSWCSRISISEVTCRPVKHIEVLYCY